MTRFELHGSPADPSVRADAAATHTRVGLLGLLADRGRRLRRARVPGSAAVVGYGWGLFDTFTQRWWPQGIATGDFGGVPIVITSWYAQPKRGVEQGVRISVIDLRNPKRPRFHHVLLVSPRREGATLAFDPVVVHAGGIVWSGDRLLVAATKGGLLEFRLSDILDAKRERVFGYRYLLPQHGEFRQPKAPKNGMLRYSFVAEDPTDDAELRLVVGEYSTGEGGRLSRFLLADDASTIDDTHVPGIAQMQGVVIVDGVWFVNASRGDKLGGDLWTGAPDAWTRYEGVLPPGPEDIAVWPERGQVWSVTEFPGKRWVYGVDVAAWRPPSSGPRA
ncbi:hypothetical protein HD599_003013 [Conyzicola lurida]|uniref:Uncharacterized protein n=1 Tax=Conyzicola lurida TaxID=1172621 RepID=A0A841AL56_9MICO|nr:hypothetical protein [Conyzicola lurida]MBB5844690.1 hypothetical protein [Conyzicola lurida]